MVFIDICGFNFLSPNNYQRVLFIVNQMASVVLLSIQFSAYFSAFLLICSEFL